MRTRVKRERKTTAIADFTPPLSQFLYLWLDRMIAVSRGVLCLKLEILAGNHQFSPFLEQHRNVTADDLII